MRRLFLIGFMGSGKSYTGRRLAQRLQLPFVDLDQWIEQQEQLSIAALFEQRGEAAFRDLEAQALRTVAAAPSIVLACGGGTPCFAGNMAWMNANGITIYLDTPIDVLVQRLLPEMDQRPLLQGLQPGELAAFIGEKLQQRESFYLQASVIFRQTSDVEDPSAELASQLGNITGH